MTIPRAGSKKDKIKRARQHAADLVPTIRAIRATGTTTLSGIAAELNRLGIPTAGSGEWSRTKVRRVLERLGLWPANTYHLVVVWRGPSLWEWEIYRNGEPLPIRLRDGNYISQSNAAAAGRVALQEFLQALERDQNA